MVSNHLAYILTVDRSPVRRYVCPAEVTWTYQERLSDLIIGPYWGTYGIVYRVLQPLLVVRTKKEERCGVQRSKYREVRVTCRKTICPSCRKTSDGGFAQPNPPGARSTSLPAPDVTGHHRSRRQKVCKMQPKETSWRVLL